MGYPLTSTTNGLSTSGNGAVTLLAIGAGQIGVDQLTIINEGSAGGFAIVNGQPLRLSAAPSGGVTQITLRSITLTSDVQIQRVQNGSDLTNVYGFAV